MCIRDRREAVRTHLLDRETMTFIGGCQTSQAMGIYYDVLDEEEKPQAFQVLLEKIEEHREHIDCGVLGARVLFHVLSDFGEVDPVSYTHLDVYKRQSGARAGVPAMGCMTAPSALRT